MLHIRTAAVTLIACLGYADLALGELSSNQEQIVVDGVSFRFGDTIEVVGICLDDRRGFASGIAIIGALQINGKATQEKLDFRLAPNSGLQPPTYKDLLKLKPESHYHVRGKLTNARINGFNDVCELIVERVEEVPSAELKVADFVDREVTFEGLAAPNGKFNYGDESVSLDGVNAWPEMFNGKHISIHGTVRKSDLGLRIEGAAWKLYRLEDLVNQPVVVDGVIASLNDNWWFDYRGERIYLTSTEGPVLRFAPGNFRRSVRVSGRLVRQDRPSLDQITLKTARDLVPTYVIRDARVELLGRALSWEDKFGPVYSSRHKSKNGVPELLAETSYRRNLMGNETRAQLFAERNSDVMQKILKGVSGEHLDELARRVDDEETDAILRLLYSAMLANANDERGRRYLLQAAQIDDHRLDLNALYCLGVFPFLAVDKNRKVDLAWVERLAIELISNRSKTTVSGAILDSRDKEPRMPVAAAAVVYTSIPSVLRRIGSDDCRRALFDYVTSGADGNEQVARELCHWEPPLASTELLQIDNLVDDRGVHRTVLRLLLAQKSPDVVDRYLNDLEDGFIYMDFRDRLSPEIVRQLKARLDQLDGDGKTHAQMLLSLGEDDAVAALLRMLNDSGWADKNLVFFELARLGDARAVAPVARFLRNAPMDAVKDDGGLSATNTVEHALDAIVHTGTAEAIRELIELLPVDLARFGGYMTRQEWRLVVAAYLIELTGESFGTDVERWRAWQQAHPTHSVPTKLANPGSGFRTNPGNAIDLGR
ncbi:hypothetical protein [Symmachiella dynata]|uniref:HEAT repeat domain-containing protein n=1 Tax=Symmachiella dynata TaxID=2527995 RepID=UPI0030EDDADB